MSRLLFVCVIVLGGLSILPADNRCIADEYLLVNGQGTNNVIKFDLGSGASSLYAQYHFLDEPRNLAMDSAGNLYSSLNGGGLNVVKLVPNPGSSVLVPTNFTASIGGDGPGQIQFYNGDLYVAGDESRVIYQYDGATGSEISTFTTPGTGNIRALAINGDTLYDEEVFQDRVHQFDLTQSPPPNSLLFQDSTNLNRVTNMTIGPQGVLVFANTDDTLIQEYSSTGVFLGTLANVKNFDSSLTSTWDVLYSPVLQNYFVSAGNEVFRLDVKGTLLQTYQSSLLIRATGLLIVPEPSTLGLALVGVLALVLLGRNRRTSGGPCTVR
jgi:hypothetical protein